MSHGPLDMDAALRLSRRFVQAETARPLYGDTVQNVEISDDRGQRYILKITADNSSRTRASIELQIAILQFLDGGTPEVNCQRAVPSQDGSVIVEWTSRTTDRRSDQSRARLVWMVKYLEGRLLDDVATYDDALLRSIGRSVAAVDARLMGFAHHGAERRIRWDLANILDLEPWISDIGNAQRRLLAQRIFARVQKDVLPAASTCPISVIHNDGGNQHNMLVATDGPARITGLIDFGDAVQTRRIYGLGIAAAYATFGCHEPRHAIECVCDGYAEVLPLAPIERRLVPGLAMARLAMSVVISSHRARLEPADHYLQVSAEPAWRSLGLLANQRQSVPKVFSRSAP